MLKQLIPENILNVLKSCLPYVGFKVLGAVIMKNTIFWDRMLGSHGSDYEEYYLLG
jgi:hypothetical protein